MLSLELGLRVLRQVARDGSGFQPLHLSVIPFRILVFEYSCQCVQRRLVESLISALLSGTMRDRIRAFIRTITIDRVQLMNRLFTEELISKAGSLHAPALE